MRNVRIANRYAKSLLDLASEQNVLDQVLNDVTLFLETCDKSRELSLLFRSPIIKPDKKEKIIDQIFAQHFHKTSLLFFKLLIQKRREMMAKSIANHFLHLYKIKQGIKSATITSAEHLDENLKLLIKEKIKNLSPGDIHLEEEIDPSLIGGFVVRIDDTEINASVLNKLNKLKQEFDTNLYIKEY